MESEYHRDGYARVTDLINDELEGGHDTRSSIRQMSRDLNAVRSAREVAKMNASRAESADLSELRRLYKQLVVALERTQEY